MNSQKLIKVCGMRDPGNIRELAGLLPDMMGFIFYPPSPRFVGFDFILPDGLPVDIEKVGVFVDRETSEVTQQLRQSRLDTAQLHGNETPEMCQLIGQAGFRVLKAFGMNSLFQWDKLEPFLSCCQGFIFDTSTPQHGGSGKKFDWRILESYPFDHPYLLSGGIEPEDAVALKNLFLPGYAGVDINSRFELKPAFKDIAVVKDFIYQYRRDEPIIS